MLKDESWPLARLIPISSATGIEAQERRAVSALLAVMGAVDEFGRTLLKPLGAPAGRIEAFIEVPFKVNNVSLRPDGILSVTRGGTTWSALIEGKTAQNTIDAAQLDLYLDLARELDFDCLITISNQFASSSSSFRSISSLGITATRQRVRARRVAVRVPPSSNARSPTIAPGPISATSRPPISTTSTPSRTR